jgi:hypothetical protein
MRTLFVQKKRIFMLAAVLQFKPPYHLDCSMSNHPPSAQSK